MEVACSYLSTVYACTYLQIYWIYKCLYCGAWDDEFRRKIPTHRVRPSCLVQPRAPSLVLAASPRPSRQQSVCDVRPKNWDLGKRRVLNSPVLPCDFLHSGPEQTSSPSLQRRVRRVFCPQSILGKLARFCGCCYVSKWRNPQITFLFSK